MADVYRIQAVINLGGNIAPELNKILKTMDHVEKEAKGVEKSLGRWVSPIDRATASVGKFARAMADARKNAHGVDREIARMRSGLSGLKAPAGGMDREIAKWATALGRPLAEMRNMRRETQGVGSAVSGISRNVDSWAGRISKATSAMRQLQRAAANVHLPQMPHGVGGGYVGGGRRGGSYSGSGSRSRRQSNHGRAGHEGSVFAAEGGGYLLLEAGKYVLEKGAESSREAIRAKNAGLTPDQDRRLTAKAGELSQTYPSVSIQDIREQGRLLIPNVGDFDAAMNVLPLYIQGQTALQTTKGPTEGKKQMAGLARALDIWGHSMSPEDSRTVLDGFVRALGVDAEAITSNDYVNAAQASGVAGKSLSPAFKAGILPALISQQGGARSGTDIASAFQNTIVGRGTAESLFHQYDSGLREGFKWHYSKQGKRIIDNKGGLVDAQLYGSNMYEWDKKHLVPLMVKKGMLPAGYAKGDYSESLSEEQKVNSSKFLSDHFSNRRGANLHSMLINDMQQIEQFLKRLANAVGLADVLKDSRNDPYVATHSVGIQGGNAASAWSLPSMGRLTDEANKAAEALGGVGRFFTTNPGLAEGTFSTFLASALGVGAAGSIGVAGLLAPLFANPVGLAIGTATFVITGTALFPWDKMWKAMGFDQGLANGGKNDYGKPINPSSDLPGLPDLWTKDGKIGPYDFGKAIKGNFVPGAKVLPNSAAGPDAPLPTDGTGSPILAGWRTFQSWFSPNGPNGPAAPGFGGAIPSLPRMGFEPTGGVAGGAVPEQIKAAGDAIGQAGQTAAPPLKSAGEAATAATGGLNSAAGAANSLAGAAAAAAAKLSSMPSPNFGSFGLPGGVKPYGGTTPGAGTGGDGAAAPAAGAQKTSAVYRGGSQTIQVTSIQHLDGRAVGRSVTRHQVAQLNVRNGTGRFDSTGLMTPVGFSEPITA